MCPGGDTRKRWRRESSGCLGGRAFEVEGTAAAKVLVLRIGKEACVAAEADERENRRR